MMFSTIIGHERPLSVLTRALANNTLAHAYIFSGQAGIGKKLTAFALAAAVNCRKAGPGTGCGECPSCRRIASGGHPDVHLVESGGEEIKIDRIRELQSDLALKPFEGAKKILIIDGAEDMNVASANAFLKTLEEPPGDALIILVTSMPQGLLPTIRSRCQEIRFLPLSRQTLAHALIERRGFSEEDAWLLAALAQGSMGRGMEMDLEQEKAAREEAALLWTGLAQTSPVELLSRAEALAKDREGLERMIDMGIEQLRDTLVLRETGDDRLLVNVRGKNLYGQKAAQLPLQRMFLDMDLLTGSRVLLDRRVSAQLVVENLFMKLGR
jgi:DNA polymerase-3 subunit delta'